MARMVQIRGISASGKTTMMRSFIARHGLKYRPVGNIPAMNGNGMCVLGDYTKPGCAGPDRISPVALIEKYLKGLVDCGQFGTVLFEHKLLSSLYDATLRICGNVGKGNYGIIHLCSDFNKTINMVYARNGGKAVNVENSFNSYRATIKSVSKLKAAGIRVLRIDPYEYQPIQLGELVDDFMAEAFGNGPETN